MIILRNSYYVILLVLSSDPSFLPSSHPNHDQPIPIPENPENLDIQKVEIPETPEITEKSEILENSKILENSEIIENFEISENFEIFESEVLENSDQGMFVSSIHSTAKL